MSVIKITSENFESEVLKAEKPVLVDFWAEWCGPCRMMAPVVEELEKEMGNEVKFAKINIDECPELAEKYNVMGIPTFKCFKNGTEIGTTVGVQGKGDLVRIIKL